MNKRFNKAISNKNLLVFYCLALIICVVPLLMAAHCTVPALDDFSFSAETRHAFLENSSIVSVIKAGITKTIAFYGAWQGSFSAVFLMTLQPGIWGYAFYSITTYVMLAAIIFGTFFFCTSLFQCVFHMDRFLPGIVASILVIFSLQFMPSPYEGLFWYNSAMYYTFFYGLTLSLFALIIRFLNKSGYWRMLLICCVSFIVGAGNYVTAILTLVVYIAVMVAFAVSSCKKWRRLLLPFFIFMAAMIISVRAPGNAVRQSENPIHPGIVEAVFLSMKTAVTYIGKWANMVWLGMMLLLIPVFLPAVKERYFSIGCPVIITLFSFLLFSAMFCPHIYAMGTAGPGRILNILYFSFLLFSAVNLFCWCGWLTTKKAEAGEISFFSELVTLLAALTVIFLSVEVSGTSLSSVLAVSELKSGVEQAYYSENVDRLQVLNDASVKNAELEYLQNTPILIFNLDMGNDPAFYVNRGAATYFYKDSIIVR